MLINVEKKLKKQSASDKYQMILKKKHRQIVTFNFLKKMTHFLKMVFFLFSGNVHNKKN